MTTASVQSTPPFFVLDSATAPAYWLVGTLWHVLASGLQTGTRFALLEQVMPTGLGPCTHRHPQLSEGFYVLEGTCVFNAQGQQWQAGPGTLVHLPPLLPHSFSVETTEARVLNFYTPAGFEMVVMSCGQVAAELRRPTPAESAPPRNLAQLQILSDLYGQQAVTALPFAQPSTPELLRTSPTDQGLGPLHIAVAAQVPPHHLFQLAWRVLATAADTAAAYDMCEVSAPAGLGLSRHRAPSHTGLYVMDGQVRLHAGDEPARLAGRGAFAFVPAGTASAWQAEGGPARLLLFHLPGGFAQVPGGFAQAVAQANGDAHRAYDLLAAHGVVFEESLPD